MSFRPATLALHAGSDRCYSCDPRMSIDRAVERFGDRRGYLYFCGLGASLLARELIRPAAPEQRSGTY